jgi:hypothetical protein
MNICEGCIKQDVCKFKEEVEKYENKAKVPEPLEPILNCKYKKTENYTWTICTPSISSGTTTMTDCYTVGVLGGLN